MPRANHIPARVAMKGCTFMYVMKKPITPPMVMPISSISTITTTGSRPASSRAALATVVRAMTPPTERSMPPEMMTSA